MEHMDIHINANSAEKLLKGGCVKSTGWRYLCALNYEHLCNVGKMDAKVPWTVSARL